MLTPDTPARAAIVVIHSAARNGRMIFPVSQIPDAEPDDDQRDADQRAQDEAPDHPHQRVAQMLPQGEFW